MRTSRASVGHDALDRLDLGGTNRDASPSLLHAKRVSVRSGTRLDGVGTRPRTSIA